METLERLAICRVVSAPQQVLRVTAPCSVTYELGEILLRCIFTQSGNTVDF